MLLVNLSFLPWVDYRLKRNRAIFTHLLRQTTLFDGGLFVCPPEISRGVIGKYTSGPRLELVEHQSDRDLTLQVVQPFYSLQDWHIPSLRDAWARRIRTELDRKYLQGRPYCLWMNCPGLLSNALARELAPGAQLRVLDSSDDFKARPDDSMRSLVDELAALSDHVLCVNQVTADHIAHPHKAVFLNCTSWPSFQERRPEFRISPHFPKPDGAVYIGFIGGIHETRADVALLRRLFREFPKFKFLFVGYTDRASFLNLLTAHENVVFVPEVSYPDLSEVIRSFDVAIVPHIDNAVTRGNDLLKVLDYLACGVPVVSTICSGVERYGDAVYLASNHDQFVNYIRRLSNKEIAHDPAAGDETARENSWERQIPRLAKEVSRWMESVPPVVSLKHLNQGPTSAATAPRIWNTRRAWNTALRGLPDSMLARLSGEELVAPCFHLVTNGETPAHVRHLFRCPDVRTFTSDLDQMLKRRTPISLDDLRASAILGRRLPPRPIFISFDDGMREMADVVGPLCRAKGVPVTFFLTTGFLNNRSLFFRHKASLLVEAIAHLSSGALDAAVKSVRARLGDGGIRIADPRQFLLGVRYREAACLDVWAEVLGVDFNRYLEEERPYLNNQQVTRLLADGFSIGGHSVDHPLFADLCLEEQLQQTQTCLNDLAARFSAGTRSFAFPFVSEGVGQAYFDTVFARDAVDMLFCIGATPSGYGPRVIERFGVESPQSVSAVNVWRERASGQLGARVSGSIRGSRVHQGNRKPAVAGTFSDGNRLVSILIPSYNAERWIGQCIESALAQTYEPKEVIVVDDGSTDDTARVVESFGEKVHFERLNHGGANAARNHLLELSRGHWLQYLDADDFLMPDKVSRQMEATAKHPKADIIFSPVRLRFEGREEDAVVEIDPDADPELNFIRWGPFSTISVLFRREVLMAVEGWKPDQPCCQEHELFFRLITSGKGFRFVDNAGSVYRIHGSNTISHRDPELVIRTRMALTDLMEAHIDKVGRKTHLHRDALYIARMEAARSLYSIDRERAREFYGKAQQTGKRFVRSSPALPISYQIASAVSSLDGAEAVAAWWRRRKKIAANA